jgi:hypothetical protein
MSPYRQACAQMQSDHTYQASMDWFRECPFDIQLLHLYQLSRGPVDPFCVPQHIQHLYFAVAGEVNAPPTWSKVLALMLQVQREKEQAA